MKYFFTIKFQFTFLLGFFFLNGLAQKTDRIISLAPSITSNIYLLEQQSKLVGCTNYCTAAIADQVPEVATSITVNLEKVISLKPDLVLISPLIKQETIELLKKVGISVEEFKTPRSFEEICEQLVFLGELLGARQKANEIVGLQSQKLADLRRKVKSRNGKFSIFMQIGANPLWTAIPHTFLDDYITFVGGQNIASEMTHGAVSRESIILKDPEIIFLLTMGNFGKEEKKNWKRYKSLKAVKNDRIFIINSELACEPTPVAFIKTLEQMIEILNKLN